MAFDTWSYDSPKGQTLTDFISQRVNLSQKITEVLDQLGEAQELPKGHLLLREGNLCKQMYFIEQGAARIFYLHEGKDVTSWFYHEFQLMTSWTSFYSQTPSYEAIELTEDSRIVSLSYETLHQLYADYPVLQEFGRKMVEEQLVFLDYFYKGFMFMSASKKYELLLSIFPDVTQRVNLGHIASFLGISQETLSRIRKK